MSNIYIDQGSGNIFTGAKTSKNILGKSIHITIQSLTVDTERVSKSGNPCIDYYYTFGLESGLVVSWRTSKRVKLEVGSNYLMTTETKEVSYSANGRRAVVTNFVAQFIKESIPRSPVMEYLCLK